MKWLHKLLKGASLTTALFIFQACYGVPQPALHEYGEAAMSFSIMSKSTGKPLEGIVISGSERSGGYYHELGVTGPDGRCSLKIPYARNFEGPFLRFEDPSGVMAPKDTSLADLREREIVISMVSVK